MIDPVEFGRQIGSLIREATAPLRQENDELRKRLEAIEQRQPDKGEQGEPGRDAEPADVAEVARQLLSTDGLKALIDLYVTDAVAAIPAPKDGKDGEQGPKGERGEKGERGTDGIGLAGAMIDRDNSLIVTLTNGETKNLGVVVGRDGVNGVDGLSMADASREYDQEMHEVIERWTVGGVTKELRYPAGGIRPGGYWREGMKSLALQTVTHDGALWIALRDTATKPCLENKEDWQLAARKGRDGKDGRNGIDKTVPVKVGGDA